MTTASNSTSASVAFQDTDKSVSVTLTEISAALPVGSITIRQLLAQIGEQSLLLFCIIMTIPFLTPIPIPGVSTVFGALIMLISLSIIFNRTPWMPAQLLNRPIATEQLRAVMGGGVSLFQRIERFIRPRWMGLTESGLINRFNGFMLFLGGFLLIIPIPFIPFSNMIPGYAILFLSVGKLQRDGLFILLGYLLTIATIVYFGALIIAALAAGESLSNLIGGGFILPIWLGF